MTIFINPGSGPVDGASENWAASNMLVLARDVRDRGREVWIPEKRGVDQGDGRWTYMMSVDDVLHEIEMPGLPTEQVRWTDEPDQNIWDFPRLYVDGSSWVWLIAVNVLADPDE